MSFDGLVLKFESYIDSRKVPESLLTLWPDVARLIEAILVKDFLTVYALSDALFANAQTPDEKAFFLQCAINAAETEYNLEKRSELFKKWILVTDWASSQYCQYLRLYQSAMQELYNNSLREAEHRFRKAHNLAVQMQYLRGQMRSLFALGTLFRDRSEIGKAIQSFESAKDIAEKMKALNYLPRIEVELQMLREGIVLPKLDSEANDRIYFRIAKAKIEAELRRRDFVSARKLMLQAEVRRRKLGILREREGLFVYRPLILIGLGRKERGYALLSQIREPILKVHILKMKRLIFGLSPIEESEFSSLCDILGVSAFETLRVNEIYLRDVKNEYIRKLIFELMTNDKALGKEDICSKVFEIEYDPFVHDPKIYKLIHAAKAFFGATDLFENTYGGYRLSPKYLT